MTAFIRQINLPEVTIYDSGKPPMILIHGLLGHFDVWEKNIPILTEYFSVYDVVLPDFADSEDGFGISDYYKHVMSIIYKYGLKDITLVGNSLGGQIASYVAAIQHNLVKNLVLVSSSGLKDDSEKPNYCLDKHYDHPKVIEIIRSCFQNPQEFESTLADRIKSTFKDNPDRISGIYRTADKTKKRSIKEVLSNITARTLLIWGENDEIIPHSVGRKFESIIKNSILITIPNCKHVPQMESADDFNKNLIEFACTAQRNISSHVNVRSQHIKTTSREYDTV